MNAQTQRFADVVRQCGGSLPTRRGRAEHGETLVAVTLNGAPLGEAVFRGTPDTSRLESQLRAKFPGKAVAVTSQAKRRR